MSRMNCVRSRAILLSGILIPAMSPFTSCLRFSCLFAGLITSSLMRSGAVLISCVGWNRSSALVGSVVKLRQCGD